MDKAAIIAYHKGPQIQKWAKVIEVAQIQQI